jgi:hypothetical protein
MLFACNLMFLMLFSHSQQFEKSGLGGMKPNIVIMGFCGDNPGDSEASWQRL